MWRIEPSSIGSIAVPPFVPEGFAIFSTTRDFEGRITPEIAERIASAVRERFGIEASLRTCNQIHGANVRRAPRGAAWSECDDCDALWSDEKGVALGIKVADCLPVTMIDPSLGVIANVHAGWRGAARGITAAALDEIESSTRFDATSAVAYLGPSIRACCFEVGEEVAAQFDEKWIRRNGAKPHVDLVAMTLDVLRERGFDGQKLFDSGFCTRCETSVFHSYRRQGADGGRNLAIVAQ